MKKVEMYCANCGALGLPKTRVKGSFWIELVLWFCFLVPGLIYSVWRLTTKAPVCSSCQSTSIMPSTSPNAKAALAARAR